MDPITTPARATHHRCHGEGCIRHRADPLTTPARATPRRCRSEGSIRHPIAPAASLPSALPVRCRRDAITTPLPGSHPPNVQEEASHSFEHTHPDDVSNPNISQSPSSLPDYYKINDIVELNLIKSAQFKRGCVLSLIYNFTGTPKLTVEEFCKLIKSEHLDPILNYKEKIYNSIQITLTSDSEKIEPDGGSTKNEFNSVGDRVFKSQRNYKEVLINSLIKAKENNYDNNVEGSGWVDLGIRNMRISYYRVAMKMSQKKRKKIGNYVPYPSNLNGGSFILNVNTEKNDCVRTAMVLHFIKDRYKKTRYVKKKRMLLSDSKNKYFQFPVNIPKPISIENFDKIEKETNTNLYIYKIGKDNQGDDNLELIRVGNNPKVDEKRWIYLVQIQNNNHVALITDVQKYIINIRSKKYKPEQLKNSKFCTICFHRTSLKNYKRHFDQCSTFKAFQRVNLPDEGATYKFNAHQATSMSPIVCYYDTESKLVPSSIYKNATHEHQILSYMYTIVDRCSNKRVFKIETGGDNLAENLIKNLRADYEMVYTEMCSKLNDEPILTETDWANYRAADKCHHCNRVFNPEKKVFKVRHHDWLADVTYGPNKKVIKGNYVAALCRGCNFRITEKRRTLTCIAHHGSLYDSRYILQGLTSKDDAQILAKPGEKYIQIKVKEDKSDQNAESDQNLENDQNQSKKIPLILQFIDSLSFLNGSLDTLTESLKASDHDFAIFKDYFKNKGFSDDFCQLLLRKGVYPYEHVKSEEDLEQTCLPPKENFYSSLKQTGITDDDYAFAQEVFRLGKCHNLKEYMELYLQCDVLLLCEIFERFRDIIMKHFGLDPSKLLTISSLSIQAASR